MLNIFIKIKRLTYMFVVLIYMSYLYSMFDIRLYMFKFYHTKTDYATKNFDKNAQNSHFMYKISQN